MAIEATDSNFQQTVLNSPIPVVVDFWATWCGPCRAIAPVLEDLAKEYAGKVALAKVDTDTHRAIASQYRISALPTLLVFKDGKVINQMVGAGPRPKLAQLFQQAL